MSKIKFMNIPFYTDQPPIKMSEKVNQWWGAFREGFFYEPELIDFFFRKLKAMRKTDDQPLFFLDVGTNTGSFCFMTLFDKNIECAAFEPNKEVYEILCENIDLNDLNKQLKSYNFGLWNEDTTKELKIPVNTKDSGLSTLGSNPTRFAYDNQTGEYTTMKIECKKLDTCMNENYFTKKVDAIKIDSEGAELFILKGAKELLQRDKPMILLEYFDLNTQQFGYNREEKLFS